MKLRVEFFVLKIGRDRGKSAYLRRKEGQDNMIFKLHDVTHGLDQDHPRIQSEK